MCHFFSSTSNSTRYFIGRKRLKKKKITIINLKKCKLDTVFERWRSINNSLRYARSFQQVCIVTKYRTFSWLVWSFPWDSSSIANRLLLTVVVYVGSFFCSRWAYSSRLCTYSFRPYHLPLALSAVEPCIQADMHAHPANCTYAAKHPLANYPLVLDGRREGGGRDRGSSSSEWYLHLVCRLLIEAIKTNGCMG